MSQCSGTATAFWRLCPHAHSPGGPYWYHRFLHHLLLQARPSSSPLCARASCRAYWQRSSWPEGEQAPAAVSVDLGSPALHAAVLASWHGAPRGILPASWILAAFSPATEANRSAPTGAAGRYPPTPAARLQRHTRAPQGRLRPCRLRGAGQPPEGPQSDGQRSVRLHRRGRLAAAVHPAGRQLPGLRRAELQVGGVADMPAFVSAATPRTSWTSGQQQPLAPAQWLAAHAHASSCCPPSLCRRAKEVLEAAAGGGELAPYGSGARVIYGHTDSLFVLLPEVGRCRGAPEGQAATGPAASAVVTVPGRNPPARSHLVGARTETPCACLLLLAALPTRALPHHCTK